jgi:hypothetical protein
MYIIIYIPIILVERLRGMNHLCSDLRFPADVKDPVQMLSPLIKIRVCFPVQLSLS